MSAGSRKSRKWMRVGPAVALAGIIILTAAVLTARAQTPAPAPSQAPAPNQAPAAPGAPAPVPADYLLGPGDVIDVAVFGEADLTKSHTIRPDGKINLQLAGEILAAGSTATQLAEKITNALRPYLKQPRVTVTLATMAASRKPFVYVVGEVHNPGAFELKQNWTVMEVIAEAGGVTAKAALTKAQLIRRTTNETMPLDLDKLIRQGDKTANAAVEAGDVIMVPEFLNRVLVWGHVKTPGAFDMKENARVLDALLQAGGPADNKAHLESVGVIRQTPQGQRTLVATVDVNKILKKADQSQNILLQHADIVYVPQANRVSWQEILSYLSGFTLIRALFGF